MAVEPENLGHHASHSRARVGLVKGLRDLRAAPTALRAAHALDEALRRAPHAGNYVMAPQVHGRSHIGHDSMDTKGRIRSMTMTSITPSIGVTIGRQTRLYYAYITTAPAALDAPSTVTLCTSTLIDLAGLALDEIGFDACRARTRARLILVDATERSHQRRRSQERKHLLA